MITIAIPLLVLFLSSKALIYRENYSSIHATAFPRLTFSDIHYDRKTSFVFNLIWFVYGVVFTIYSILLLLFPLSSSAPIVYFFIITGIASNVYLWRWGNRLDSIHKNND